MALRVCVLGNSHVASLKGGWDIVAPEFPGYELVFFASKGVQMAGLGVEGSALVAQDESLATELRMTSGGLDRIEFGGYDAFLIYGLGLILPVLAYGLSRAVVNQTISDLLDRCLSMRFSRIILERSRAPLFVGPAPQGIRGRHDFDLVSIRSYSEALEELRTGMGDLPVNLMPQLQESLADRWYSKAEFTSGMRRARVTRGLDKVTVTQLDHKHLNADYGAMYLRQFLGRDLNSLAIRR